MAIKNAEFGVAMFPNNWKLLDVKLERRLIAHEYPHNAGAEHEDLGEGVQRFIAECFFAGDQVDDFADLQEQFEDDTPDFLYIPGRGIFWCRFEKLQVSEKEGEAHRRHCRLEFVETLKDDLQVERTEDYETQLEDVQTEGGKAGVLAQLWSDGKQLYNDALVFVDKLQNEIGSIQQQIKVVKNAVERPLKELQRLSGQIETLAVESLGVYKACIAYADVPYILARSFKNISNTLTSVSRQFSPPPVDGKNILDNQMQGRMVTYTVRSVDTLELICVEFYGTVATMSCVMDANGINDPLSLKAGDVLLIPELAGKPLKKVTIELPKSEVGIATCSEL